MFENENESTEIVESNEGSEVEPQNLETQPSTEQPQVIDLDSAPKWRFDGRDWTKEEFKSAYLMQKDYTQKTQAISEERKFNANLRSDLASVRQNPALVEEFKRIYPRSYHAYLDLVQAQQAAKQESAAPAHDNGLGERLSKIESRYYEQEVASIEAELDAKFKGLSGKYPMADEEAVLARANALLDKIKLQNPGEKPRISDNQWDALWKSVHDKHKSISDKHYSSLATKQKQANSKGRDVPSGGGIPGQAPKMPRTIKEATAMALREIEQQ